ncbi:MAG: hypothetical protein DRN04_19405 [Thermoprotei archaeon]|nr:MAG: hypothetical protein DRN04_19405 [Thermoprotei archaeon]
MYTTVKIKVEAKKKLEEIQTRLRLHGIKASLHEILEKLIELGLDEEDNLLRKFMHREEEDPMLHLLENPLDWDVEDASIKIDEALYGEPNVSFHRYGSIRSSKK